MNTPVSFEISKLLKIKGYPIEIDYGLQQVLNNHNVPTIVDVVMWIYEKHGIWILVNIDISDKWYFEFYNLKDKRNAEIFIDNEEITDFHNSPTEAYSAAIIYCLTNLV